MFDKPSLKYSEYIVISGCYPKIHESFHFVTINTYYILRSKVLINYRSTSFFNQKYTMGNWLASKQVDICIAFINYSVRWQTLYVDL